MGVNYVDTMAFSADFLVIREQLLQTFEMKQMYERDESMPDMSFNELHKWLPALKAEGSHASCQDFLKLVKSLRSFESVRTFFTRKSGHDEESPLIFPKLANLFSRLELFPQIVRSIENIIDKNGEVKDSASPDLADVRSRLKSIQGKITGVIHKVLETAIKDGVIDSDASPTFRDGRMVIPVPAANKRRLSGIVLDASASGKTVFIEPAETIEIANRIRELENEEQRIIVRILTALADEIRPQIDNILESNKLLGVLDFIMAKARFAIEIGGNLPILSRRPEIDWYGAFHPVLQINLQRQNRDIIPLNIRLEGKNHFLLISGPNAGGKSVVLKTVGVIQYMCQCGMLPTMHSNSHLGIFNKIFIDIGDEQSIENDLSTYSSHLKNMRYFMLHADNKSLILIDEIGSGTEPTIGAALAKSILTELAASHCYGIVTTHYHALKQFAEEQEGFINGAMLYDRNLLQPTFQLSIGSAGSSYALEIAGKIGLPKHVIENAKLDVGEDYVETDRYLVEIARDRKYWQTKRANIKERETRLEALEERYNKLIAEITDKRKEIIRQAQEEAKVLLSGTNRKIENTIAEIRSIDAEKERTKALRKELDEFKKQVSEADEKQAPIKFKHPQPVSSKKKKQAKSSQTSPNVGENVKESPKNQISNEIREGDYVKMVGSNTAGKVISVTGKEAEVAFGNLRTMVKLSKLHPAQKPKETISDNSGYNFINQYTNEAARQRQLNFKDEIDIRGLRADEALDKVIHFIDDAIQFRSSKVRILHGTGAGILRQLVRQQLSVTPGVEKYQDEDVRMGGAGITVVTLE